jgi:hypothetical protein
VSTTVTATLTASGAVAPATVHGLPSFPACAKWKVIATPDLPNDVLSGVAATSATDAWAVGYDGVLYPSPPIILRWDGTEWRETSQPISAGYLYDVAAISPSDAWAVGWYGATAPLTEHWDGEAWRNVRAPVPGTYHYLYGVSAVSSNDVWAVGLYTGEDGQGHALVLHWNGAQWSLIPAPDGVLEAVSAVSADDVWAVGYTVPVPFTAQPLIEHWDGTSWSIVPGDPPPGGDQNILYGVAPSSSTDVWAVGSFGLSPDRFRPLIQHWDGTDWNRVRGAAPGPVNAVYAVSAAASQDVWAVGEHRSGSSEDYEPLIMHWGGAGWSAQRAPIVGLDANLHAVDAISSTNAWAVGAYTDVGGHLNPLIEHSSGCSLDSGHP